MNSLWKHANIRKALSYALMLIMLLTLFSTPALTDRAEAETCVDYEYTVPDDGTAEITGYTGSDTVLDIPEELDGYTVTSIGWGAFSSCSGLTEITIPESVTSIGDYAFAFCDNLTEITIPGSVTSIGGAAFWSCDSLREITILDGVTSIGEGAFWDCDSLTEITIPGSVASTGENAFYDCSGLTEVMILDGVTSIGGGAFFNCDCLTEIIIPGSVTSIGGAAFWSCDSLTEITIPGSVTSIGGDAFGRCERLTEITIPDSVTSIGENAFGFYYDDESDCYILSEDFTIYCYENSAAHEYAVENEIDYVLLYDLTCTENEWELGDEGTLTITSNGEFSTFIGVEVDGETVSEENYTASEGSTIIEFHADYLNTLSEGAHTVTVLHTYGKATGEIEIIGNGSVLLGDVDGNGKVTAIDARLVLQAAAGNYDLGEYESAADVNGDGKITAIDARLILQAAAGNIVL